MKSKTGFVAFFVALFAFQAFADTNVCSVCTVVVDTLEGFVGKSVTKEDLMNKLDSTCSNLKKLINEKDCRHYVKLYGPYTVDMLLSEAEPSKVCSNLGLCDTNEHKGPNYEILYPTFNEESIVYKKEEKVAKNEFHYKFFIGNSTELLNTESTSLRAEFTKITGEFDFVLFQKENGKKVIISASKCNAENEENCFTTDPFVKDGTWYFFDITSLDGTSFVLTNTQTEGLVVIPDASVEYVPFINFFLMTTLLMGIFIFCCGCCVFCLSSKKRKCKKEKEVQMEEVHTAMPIDQTMVGYYYPMPVTYDGQYIPMDPRVPQVFPQAPTEEY